MRIYKVKLYCGQYEVYYVHANDVASAAKSAMDRDDKIASELEVEPDHYRRVVQIDEFCETEQFVGPPVSFVKKIAA